MKKQIKEFIEFELKLKINKNEVSDFYDKIKTENDFYIEINGKEYRIIKEDIIWDVYVDSIKEIAEEYTDIPNWISIDWEETAGNCYVDGYGYTFSTYDGSELEYKFNNENYFIFRTN